MPLQMCFCLYSELEEIQLDVSGEEKRYNSAQVLWSCERRNLSKGALPALALRLTEMSFEAHNRGTNDPNTSVGHFSALSMHIKHCLGNFRYLSRWPTVVCYASCHNIAASAQSHIQNPNALSLKHVEEGSPRLHNAGLHENTMRSLIGFGEGSLGSAHARPSELVEKERLVYLHGWYWTG